MNARAHLGLWLVIGLRLADRELRLELEKILLADAAHVHHHLDLLERAVLLACSMMRAAIFAPTPGSVAISVAEAVLMFTTAVEAGSAWRCCRRRLSVRRDVAPVAATSAVAATSERTIRTM